METGNDARAVDGSVSRHRARGALIAAMLGAVAVLATACPGPDPAAPPVPTGTRSRITSYAGASGNAVISADGQWVAYIGDQTSDDDGAVYLWSRSSLMVTTIIGQGNGGLDLIGISGDGRYVTIGAYQAIDNNPSTGFSPFLYSYDRVDAVLRFVGEVNDSQTVAAAGNGTVTYRPRGGNSGDISSWDPATQTTTPVLAGTGNTFPLAVSPNGSYLALFTSDTDIIGVTVPGLYRRTSAGVVDLVVAITQPFGLTGDLFPNNLAVTNDGDVIYTVFGPGSGPLVIGTGSTMVWSGSTHATETISVPGRIIATTGVSPDGRFLTYLSEAAPLDTEPFDGALGVFPADGRLELLDRQTSITKLIGYGRVGIGELINGSVAADGSAALVFSNDPAGDANGNGLDVFFWEDTP